MAVRRKEWDDVKEKTLQTPRPVKKEGKEVLKMLEQGVLPCSPWWRPWWGTLSPAVHRVPQWSRAPPVAHGKDTIPEQMAAWRRLWPHGEPALDQASARTCGPMERGAHARAGLLAGPVTPWGTHAGAAYSWRTAPRGKDPRWGSSWRREAHGKDFCWSSLWRTVSCESNLHTGAGEECEQSSPWGGSSGRDNVWKTDHNSHSPSLCAPQWEEGEK